MQGVSCGLEVAGGLFSFCLLPVTLSPVAWTRYRSAWKWRVAALTLVWAPDLEETDSGSASWRRWGCSNEIIDATWPAEAECFICLLQAASRDELAQRALGSQLSRSHFCRLMKWIWCILYLYIPAPFVCNLCWTKYRLNNINVVIMPSVARFQVLDRRIK